MARVRFLQAVGGTDYSYTPGEVVDLPGEEAEAWADGVRAELVRGEAPETPESNAASRGPRLETAAQPKTVVSHPAEDGGGPITGKKTVRRPADK